MPVRLFVGNLPYDATEDDIRAHFSTAGNVLNVFVPLDRETGRKRGFAFVEFNDNAEAQEAIRLFNNQSFKGRPLAVNEARAKESRPPGSRRPGGGFRPRAPGRRQPEDFVLPDPAEHHPPATSTGRIPAHSTSRAAATGPAESLVRTPSRSRTGAEDLPTGRRQKDLQREEYRSALQHGRRQRER